MQQDGTVYANAVLVGTDERVLARVRRFDEAAGPLWRYGGSQFLPHQSLGDSFPVGYGDERKKELPAVMNIIRQQAERYDRLEGMLALLSLAGGTGTGFGTKVIQAFKDTYPSTTVVAMAVWPFTLADTTVPPYNGVLGPWSLQKAADATVLLSNDSLLEIAEKKRQRPRKGNLGDTNSAGARQLACLRRPSYGNKGHGMRMADVVEELKCGGGMKYLSLLHTPWATTSYDSFNRRVLARSLRRPHQSAGRGTKPMRCLAALTVARGDGVSSLDPSDIELDEVQGQSTWRRGRRFLGDEKTLLLASNGHACLPQLAQAKQNAARMYRKGAFLHNYCGKGVEDDAITEANTL